MNKELQKKVNFGIKLIQSASKKAASVGQVVEVCYSGGKDSDVILELTRMANVPYRAIYKNTTIDPPYTIAHCKNNGVEIMRPKKTFAQLLQEKGAPNRFSRFCCSVLKEYKVLDYAILGVRANESANRAKRYREPEVCRNYSKKEKVRQYYPILNWTLEDEEEFIKERGIKLHPLYYVDGRLDLTQRLGCMCCPLASTKKRIAGFKKYPRMVDFYVRNIQKRFDSAPNAKYTKSFHNDACECLVWSILCSSLAEWKELLQPDLFGNRFNAREWLKLQFNYEPK